MSDSNYPILPYGMPSSNGTPKTYIPKSWDDYETTNDSDDSIPPDVPVGSPVRDYPPPAVLSDKCSFIWDADLPACVMYPSFARRLVQAGDIYQLPGYNTGLTLASTDARVPQIEITDAATLATIINDRVRIQVIADGKLKGSRIPTVDLKAMLGSRIFLDEFPPLDNVVTRALYLPDYRLTTPGYHDGGRGNRVLYAGDTPWILSATDAINKFLDVMEFASNADRTNAVAAALTIMLRNHFLGGKPIVVTTASKSNAGKETVIEFASGNTRKVSISYESTDWALQKSFVTVVKHDPDIGVINVENARIRGDQVIASAYLERFLTDPEPTLFSPGTGEPVKRHNDLVVTMSTNFGTISEDLMNRALPIHLTPKGDVANRKSPIGNPKLEYLPENRDRIEAELRGMIEKWRQKVMPLDMEVKHPFSLWARTIGGMLQANGYTDFLGNYAMRKTIDDPVKKALGILGASRSGQWFTATMWAPFMVDLGLVGTLLSKNDRETAKSRARGLGVVMSKHVDETYVVETDAGLITLKLEKGYRRFVPGEEPETRYRFVPVTTTTAK